MSEVCLESWAEALKPGAGGEASITLSKADLRALRNCLRASVNEIEGLRAKVTELEAALGRGHIERCVQCGGSGELLNPQLWPPHDCDNCDATGHVLMRDGKRVALMKESSL